MQKILYVAKPHVSRGSIARCESIIGYTFRTKSLCREALTNVVNFRLAIYGDVVLSAELCRQWVTTDQSSGNWNNIRSSITSNKSLAKTAEQYGLQDLISYHTAVGGGAWNHATVVEAILGAVMLDGGDVALRQVMETLELTDKLNRRVLFAMVVWKMQNTALVAYCGSTDPYIFALNLLSRLYGKGLFATPPYIPLWVGPSRPSTKKPSILPRRMDSRKAPVDGKLDATEAEPRVLTYTGALSLPRRGVGNRLRRTTTVAQVHMDEALATTTNPSFPDRVGSSRLTTANPLILPPPVDSQKDHIDEALTRAVTTPSTPSRTRSSRLSTAKPRILPRSMGSGKVHIDEALTTTATTTATTTQTPTTRTPTTTKIPSTTQPPSTPSRTRLSRRSSMRSWAKRYILPPEGSVGYRRIDVDEAPGGDVQ